MVPANNVIWDLRCHVPIPSLLLRKQLKVALSNVIKAVLIVQEECVNPLHIVIKHSGSLKEISLAELLAICATFPYIDVDNSDPASDDLDSTRVHAEDYDIERKMATDALELEEEDDKAETECNGQGAVVWIQGGLSLHQGHAQTIALQTSCISRRSFLRPSSFKKQSLVVRIST